MRPLNIAVAILVASFSTPVLSQDNAQIAERVTKARQENAAKTTNYSWTQRTEVKVKGEVKSTTTELVRYTVDGEMQKTPISQDKAKGPKGVRGKIAKKKGGEMKDWMTELGGVLKQYSLPTPESLTAFLDKAKVEKGSDGVTLSAVNVVVPVDTMTMFLDPDLKLTRTEVATEHDGAAVQLTTEHATTPDGLDYVARTVILVPDKNVEMTVESFSYQLEK
jgi:hypothetical protein